MRFLGSSTVERRAVNPKVAGSNPARGVRIRAKYRLRILPEEVRGDIKMGHLRTDIVVKGNKTAVRLKSVLINTGATYTVLPERILKEIGAWGPMRELEVELGNGKRVKAKAYGVVIGIKDTEAPSICIGFEGGKTVIGIETLESIGLKLNPTTGKLEFTRPKGMAYFYSG